ncbi:hypothetical protein E8E13_004324 [Curvularia kusanoi]|uniref:non-specific serine/threonine protein kinase n=1 Tax=Curvularia kusanoi TaxID=90978 RepID=A0A9P4T5N6_CURKU|nr:hypothetical protein E8E13_004324 [Curvularia kusanoi]
MSSVPTRIVHQPGLQWNDEGLPEWSKDPSTDIMRKLIQQNLDLEEEPELSFFAKGALNKLFAFDCRKGRFLIRVTLPVAPRAKTDSEIATIAFIRKQTKIPVPEVVAYCDDLENELGFEWMIMRRIEAQPLHDMWHQLPWLKKQLIVQQLAVHWVELFDIRISGIGSIHTSDMYPNRYDGNCEDSVCLGEIVLPGFFMDGRYQLDIDRGPYNSSRNYLNSCLEWVLHSATKLLESEDEDEVEHGQSMQTVYERLQKVIPRYFRHHSHKEETLLLHRDVTAMNILVNKEGEIVSIVDWECIAAVPIWQACELPSLLRGTVHQFISVPGKVPETEEDHEDRNEFYEQYHMDYEVARLRTFFLEEMQRLSPEWTAAFQADQVRHDIALAISCCYEESYCNWIGAWLKALLEGPEPTVSLEDAIRSPKHRREADWFQAWLAAKRARATS